MSGPILLRKPPRPPNVPLPKAPEPSWFDKVLATVQGVSGLPLTDPANYERGGESLDRYTAAGELGQMLSLGTLGMAAAKKGVSALSQMGRGSLRDLGGKRIANPIKAYHGSPHDFDQFSMEKIGTGEGAQAYGHGLYFAEREGVAQDYRKRLERLPEWLDKYQDDITAMEQRALESGDEKLMATAQMHRHNWLKEAEKQHGRMYEVNIHASPDELLDWDKPLSQQSEKVRAALAQMPEPKLSLSERKATIDPTGAQAYEGIGRRMWWDKESKLGDKAGAASTALRERGIKGIQYLDQGSRGRTGGSLVGVTKGPDGWQARVKVDRNGDQMFTTSTPYATEAEARAWADKAINTGTRNFVIFDDELIEIARKYGIPIAVAASIVQRQGGTVERR